MFIGAGKLGLPDNAVIAFALGADTVNVGREAMLALGCIQAQKCHTDRCPTGVATQSPWLTRGLDPALKSVRVANYVKTLRRDLLKVSEACGVEHPGLIDADAVELLDAATTARPLRELFGYQTGLGASCARRSPGDHRLDDRHCAERGECATVPHLHRLTHCRGVGGVGRDPRPGSSGGLGWRGTCRRNLLRMSTRRVRVGKPEPIGRAQALVGAILANAPGPRRRDASGGVPDRG